MEDSAQGDQIFGVENVIGSNYNDILRGNNSDNVLNGGHGNDGLVGGGGNDTLLGGAGDDYFMNGGPGADILDGGLGNDTANYSGSSTGVFVSLYNDLAFYGDAAGDDLNGIENLEGSSHDDELWGHDGANDLSGYHGDDTLKGFGGDDVLSGHVGDDKLYGMDGADTLYGWTGVDLLVGGDGDDVLNGGPDGDTLIGGTGNDTYYIDGTLFDGVADIVIEQAGEGYDIVYSNAYATTLADNVETLSLEYGLENNGAVYGTGNALDNGIIGNDNDNVLDGGGGADDLWGLGGNDTFVLRAGQAHGDRIHEFYGNGAGAGDVLRFEGYGTLAQGATFHQLSATQWQITSADGLTQETITLATGAIIDTTTDLIFV
jgi:Ca2+-binding RTX toxin-like protein